LLTNTTGSERAGESGLDSAKEGGKSGRKKEEGARFGRVGKV